MIVYIGGYEGGAVVKRLISPVKKVVSSIKGILNHRLIRQMGRYAKNSFVVNILFVFAVIVIY